jgi:peptidoglycan/xylan/chitin deacetylase (PgdA/CDA1 family)
VSPLDEHPFALCLTHDVDRPYKRATHGLFYAPRGRLAYNLRTALPDRNPYWQFETVMDVERERGVRSAFYFLDQPHLLERSVGEWLSLRTWIEHLGRYDLSGPAIETVLRELVDGGWEVGLHGSLPSATDPDRLADEKARLESLAGTTVLGCRQHHLHLERPGTWRRQHDVGLRYDASLGFADDCGFQHGHDPLRPFDDEFVVYPLTIMEQALPDPGTDPEAAWAICEDLLAEAADEGAVMTVLWHPRMFSEPDFPGYRAIYERLLDRALELGAWVGPPGDLYQVQETGSPRRAV